MSAALPTPPPPSICARVLYAGYLVAGIGALAGAALALGAGEWRPAAAAAGLALAALLLRNHLADSGELAACAAEDDAPIARYEPEEPVVRQRRAPLVARLATLERLRGTPQFDPWEWLAVRRQLAALTSAR